jgi:hypothetical protein
LGTAPITVHKDSSQQHASLGKAAFSGRIRLDRERFGFNVGSVGLDAGYATSGIAKGWKIAAFPA